MGARRVARIALSAWCLCTLGIGAAMTGLHQTPLPAPELVRGPTASAFRLIHALSTECPCSVRVLEYLVERGATSSAEEVVLLVGDVRTWEPALRQKGFTTLAVNEEQLTTEFSIRSAPSLVVLRPDGTPAYQGAYAPRPQMDPIDLELLATAQRGETTASMPILGCALSRALQQRLDPLNLKYR